jgi:pimeloyl-ACP methyl ester carboxylesterase
MRKLALIGSRKTSAENEALLELHESGLVLNRANSTPVTKPHPSQRRLGTFSTPQIESPFGQHLQRKRQDSVADSNFGFSDTQIVTSFNNTSPDILGLQLVCDNEEPAGDIVFVHGLGGTATRTWSWKRDINFFWPPWLTDEEDLSNFWIFSFGYDSNFKGAATNLNTTDFAKDLLFSMLTFTGGFRDGADNSIPIGSRPIIFVAHSMGGLVVKKAYVLGKHDRQFSSLIAQVYGMVFLATPHRGAQYAKMLNNILSTTPLGAAPKAYVAELDTQSSSLQDINEQFRTCCEDLLLASFYETKKTSFGIGKIVVCNNSFHESNKNTLTRILDR